MVRRNEPAVTRMIRLRWKVFISMSSMYCSKKYTYNIKRKNSQNMCKAGHDIWLGNLGGKIR